MSEQMRKEFEAWASQLECQLPLGHHEDIARCYKNIATAWAWSAWQAALATQPQAPQVAVAPDMRGIDGGDIDEWLHLVKHGEIPRDTMLMRVCDAAMAMTPYEKRAPKTETPEVEK